MFDMRCAVVWITLLMAGCATTSGGAPDASANIGNVEIGMTQEQLLSILGQPKLRESYGATEFLIYDVGSSGMPIAIVNGRVTGIGRNVYDLVRSASRSDGVQAR
jgi:hypothetical protein